LNAKTNKHAEHAISNHLAQYEGKLRKQRRKLLELDNEVASFAGDFWSDVRMFIAPRLKQLDSDLKPSPRSLLKAKKKGTRRGPSQIP
jgi:hypothetical protein